MRLKKISDSAMLHATFPISHSNPPLPLIINTLQVGVQRSCGRRVVAVRIQILWLVSFIGKQFPARYLCSSWPHKRYKKPRRLGYAPTGLWSDRHITPPGLSYHIQRERFSACWVPVWTVRFQRFRYADHYLITETRFQLQLTCLRLHDDWKVDKECRH
jgi:hypothetical protein